MIPTTAPRRNIEIKAKIRNYENLISKTQALCLSHGEIIQQEDVFFNVPAGRLKLRERAVSVLNSLMFHSNVLGFYLFNFCKMIIRIIQSMS